jgi:hypothetical protein
LSDAFCKKICPEREEEREEEKMRPPLKQDVQKLTSRVDKHNKIEMAISQKPREIWAWDLGLHLFHLGLQR